MRAPLSPELATRPFARDAADIVRSCVHCGFCNATCPTYQLSGDEREGPRGRIYLMKALLENDAAGPDTREHLNHCLQCRSCETTCPSGVQYGRLLDLVRPHLDQLSPPPLPRRLLRAVLLRVLPHPARLRPLVAIGRLLRPLLPRDIATQLGRPSAARDWPAPRHPRRVLLLGGCVQPVLRPAIDVAAARLFDAAGLSLLSVPGSHCCGALAHHLGDEAGARAAMRANLDAWGALLDERVEAIVTSASACTLELKDYGRLLADDPHYGELAQRVAALVRDPVEVLERETGALAGRIDGAGRVLAFHAPCTLQHGQRLPGRVERLLGTLGFRVAPVADGHLCCGAAGTHVLFEPHTAERLRTAKLERLMEGRPTQIASANIGCLLHLESAAPVPVQHWLEVLAETLD